MWLPRPVWVEIQRELAFLREQVGVQHDHERRLERTKAGLYEVPAQPKKPKEPMPDQLRDWLLTIDNEVVRQRLQEEAETQYRRTGNWDAVVELILTKTEEEA